MIKVKLAIEVTNGTVFDSCELSIDASNWRSDEDFLKKINEYKATIKSLNKGWSVEGNEDMAYIDLSAIDRKDVKICYALNEIIESFE